MNGLEALDNLVHCKSITKCKECRHKDLCTMERDYNIIKKDLDRLEELERSYKRLEFVYKNECEEHDKIISDMNYNYGVAKLLIDTLQEENEELAKEYAEECKEWADIVEKNDKAHLFFVNNQAKLIKRYIQAIKILKEKVKLNIYYLSLVEYEDGLTIEEYELLKEVFEYE